MWGGSASFSVEEASNSAKVPGSFEQRRVKLLSARKSSLLMVHWLSEQQSWVPERPEANVSRYMLMFVV